MIGPYRGSSCAGKERVFVLNVDDVPRTETVSLLRFHAKWHPTDFMYLNAAEFESGQHSWPGWPLLL